MDIQKDSVTSPATPIHYPREYFAAAVTFAARISQIAGISILEAIAQYTGLYRDVTGRQGLEGGSDPLWAEVAATIAELRDPDAMLQVIYDTYRMQPHSVYESSANSMNATVFGALGYLYEVGIRQVRIHFFPQRSRESALSSRHFQERRDDFRRLLVDIRTRYPAAETIKSSSWLQNLPNYRNLFPQKFQARLKDIGGSTYLGIWGQFVRGDGSGNLERLAAFHVRLAQAQSVEEAIDAFPFKVLEAIGPIQEFYDAYEI